MKILLVYPKYPHTFWSFDYILKYIRKRAAFPPLGLATIASMLPQEWEKKLVDLNIEKLEKKDIEWADMIFISAMLIQKFSAQGIIDLCKSLGKTVVAGGPAFTTGHEKFTGVDHFVLNEAEVTLPIFLEDLKKGDLKSIYTSDKKPDLSLTPLPDFSLIKMKHYSTMSVQFTRGCPHACEFCDIIALFGQKTRMKSSKQIIEELNALFLAGWRGAVFFVDDNFIGHKNKVKKMLPELIKWQKEHNFPFAFLTEVSVKLADDKELIEMMIKARFNKVFVGIETPNKKALMECKKMQNVNRDLSEVVRILHESGLQVMGGFIVGFDSDDESIFNQLKKFIMDTGIVNAMVGILTALPQTALFKRLEAENRLLSEATGENTDGILNFIPKMGADELVNGYKDFIRFIYSPKEYYKRINVFLKNYNSQVKDKITFIRLYAFWRSLWRIGIFSKARFYYWKLIGKTFFTNIRLFPEAVELAILGEHFRKVAKKI